VDPRFVLGIVEGFYGRPWSWAQRESMLEFLAARGFNFYFYAPKNDPLHRNRWREPYLEAELERFERFGRRCIRLGIELCVGVSPLRYRHGERGELELLWSKLEAFRRAGIRSFGILLDDMAPSDVRKQVGLLNSVWERLRSAGAERLTFTPTEYCGSGDSSYLACLGAGLDPAIDVFWTGPQVCSPRITAEHLRTVAATLKRKPLLWDNYPVNDLDQRYEAHIRPLSGRDPELFQEARGLVSAPGPLAEAPKIALATVAEFARDPRGYEPEAAWSRALLAVAGDEDDAAALAVFGELSRRSVLELERELDNTFRRVADEFWSRWAGGDRESAVHAMEEQLAALARTADRMQRLRNRRLRRELRPWTDKLRGWVAVGSHGLGALKSGGRSRSTLRVLAHTRENFHWVMGDLMEQFARRCLWEAAGRA
jgi:hyaluronoglucosaminidase